MYAADFKCSICAEVAGSIYMERSGKDFELIRQTFTGVLKMPVSYNDSFKLAQQIVMRDAAALFVQDFELTPFYCPVCRAVYCGKHWQTRDVFDEDGAHDCIRGVCPAGHERMLED